MVFEKECIMRRSSAEWIECLDMMPSWCRQVNWGNCGIPWVNCTVLFVKDDWNGQFWGLRYFLPKLRSLLSFPSGMISHSKIAQFSWECIALWRLSCVLFLCVLVCMLSVIMSSARRWQYACLFCGYVCWLWVVAVTNRSRRWQQ